MPSLCEPTALKLLSRLASTSGPFVRNVAKLAGGSAAAQVIGLAATPFLSRLYTPVDFGILGSFLAVAGTVAAISSLVYEYAIPLPRLDRDSKLLVSATLAMNVVASVLCTAILLILLTTGEVAAAANLEPLAQHLWLLPITVLFAGAYRISNFWAVRQKQFSRVATTRMLQITAMVGVQAVGGLVGGQAIWLIAGYVASQSIGTISLLGGWRGALSFFNASPLSRRTRALLKRYAWFPKYDGPATLIDVASATLPSLLFLPLFGPAATGAYFMAERVVSGPLSYLSLAIGQVLYGDVRHLVTDGRLFPTVRRIALTLGVLTLPPVVIVVFWGPSIFALVFGESWREAGRYAAWLAPAFYVNSIYPAIAPALSATFGQRKRLIIHTIKFAAGGSAIAIGYLLQDVMIAISLLSISYIVIYAATIATIFVHSSRHDAMVEASKNSSEKP